MINVSFGHCHDSVDVVIDRIKYYATNNINDYWIIKKSVECIINKVGNSEYAEENNSNSYLNICESSISKFDELIFIDDNYNLDEDLKLGSKSLSLRYIMKLINDNIVNDEFLQLNCMINLIADMISTDILSAEAISLTAKSFTKLISVSAIKDELRCNSKDLSYEETIIFQLELLKKIITAEKRYIIIIDLTFMTETLYNEIESLENCYVLVVFQHTYKKDFGDNIMIDGIDFENDELLYERMMKMSDFYNLDEYKINKKEEYLKKLK